MSGHTHNQGTRQKGTRREPAASGAHAALGMTAGLGSFLGSGTIIALSSTLALWREGLGLDAAQVGVVSAVLTFAFAIGSFGGGFVAGRIGLVRMFNADGIVAAVALAACALAPNFAVLVAGIGVAALAVGMDLPVSLGVITHDVADETVKTRLVSRTQVLWSAGILGLYVLALVVAPARFLGARAVFGLLAALALATAVWRIADRRIAELHREAKRRMVPADGGTAERIGIRQVLAATDRRTGLRYGLLFAVLMLFYVMWNLMANTINQFQTYLLVAQRATQSQAVLVGIVAAVLCVAGGVAYGRVPKGVWRDRMFWVGAVAQIAAMVVMAAGGSMVATIVAVAMFQFFCNFAGEMNAKVWTQETFPVAVSAQAQSLILGVGRLPCAVASLVLPSLLVPGAIDVALWSFVAVAALSAVFGGAFVLLTTRRHAHALTVPEPAPALA